MAVNLGIPSFVLQEAFFRVYECCDGKFVYLVCMGHKGHIDRCIKALGIETQVRAMVPSGDMYDSSTWKEGTILEHFYLRNPFGEQVMAHFCVSAVQVTTFD